jgi:hypothetical protein
MVVGMIYSEQMGDTRCGHVVFKCCLNTNTKIKAPSISTEGLINFLVVKREIYPTSALISDKIPSIIAFTSFFSFFVN